VRTIALESVILFHAIMQSTLMVLNGLVILQIHTGVVKVEPGSSSESCVTPSDDEIEVLDMRLEGALV
jgi:hypothetical protein